MTLTSAECLREAQPLGIQRVVLPRELSVNEIAIIHARTTVLLEGSSTGRCAWRTVASA